MHNKLKIAIVGGGTAGWITAAVLSKRLGNKAAIQLIESPDIPTVGVGEATIPPIVGLLRLLDIDEREFVTQIGATFKYGIEFRDWHSIGTHYLHTFGSPGYHLAGESFTKQWLFHRLSQNLAPLSHYASSAIAAYEHKFNPPHQLPEHASPDDFYPLTQLFYAYHFDAAKVADYLKNIAVAHGVLHIQSTVKTIDRSPKGDISQLTMSDGNLVSAELFIDCSGARGLLSKQTLLGQFADWSEYLPCDHAIAVQTVASTDPLPYTRSTALSAGWSWQIPLQHRMGNGYVFSSRHLSSADAIEELLLSLGRPKTLTSPKVIPFTTGWLTRPWHHNCVAIGLSAGFFEPLESTSIHMIQKYAVLLSDLVDNNENWQQASKIFNDSYVQDALTIRDFLQLHYCTTKRTDSDFWRHCQHMQISPSLYQRLSRYQLDGSIELPSNSLFPYESWVQVLSGMRVYPHHPTAPKVELSAKGAKMFFNDVQQAIYTQVTRLPSHQAYLNLLAGDKLI